MMAPVFLGLGSKLGDRERALEEGLVRVYPALRGRG